MKKVTKNLGLVNWRLFIYYYHDNQQASIMELPSTVPVPASSVSVPLGLLTVKLFLSIYHTTVWGHIRIRFKGCPAISQLEAEVCRLDPRGHNGDCQPCQA